MLAIHPFRFARAYRKGLELDIGSGVPRHFRQSRFVVRFDLLWNVHSEGKHGFRGASWRGLVRHVFLIENTTIVTTISLALDRYFCRYVDT